MPHQTVEPEILVVVHPGSARRGLLSEITTLGELIASWRGRVVIVDSALSDSIAQTTLGAAIEAAFVANPDSLRIVGEDDAMGPESALDTVVERLFKQHPDLRDASCVFQVTGAWASHSDEFGCVNSVRDDLVAAGKSAEIHASAIFNEEWDKDCDSEMETQACAP